MSALTLLCPVPHGPGGPCAARGSQTQSGSSRGVEMGHIPAPACSPLTPAVPGSAQMVHSRGSARQHGPGRVTEPPLSPKPGSSVNPRWGRASRAAVPPGPPPESQGPMTKPHKCLGGRQKGDLRAAQVSKWLCDLIDLNRSFKFFCIPSPFNCELFVFQQK